MFDQIRLTVTNDIIWHFRCCTALNSRVPVYAMPEIQLAVSDFASMHTHTTTLTAILQIH